MIFHKISRQNMPLGLSLPQIFSVPGRLQFRRCRRSGHLLRLKHQYLAPVPCNHGQQQSELYHRPQRLNYNLLHKARQEILLLIGQGRNAAGRANSKLKSALQLQRREVRSTNRPKDEHRRASRPSMRAIYLQQPNQRLEVQEWHRNIRPQNRRDRARRRKPIGGASPQRAIFPGHCYIPQVLQALCLRQENRDRRFREVYIRNSSKDLMSINSHINYRHHSSSLNSRLVRDSLHITNIREVYKCNSIPRLRTDQAPIRNSNKARSKLLRRQT